jgi:small conductance mechanosensitive channel
VPLDQFELIQFGLKIGAAFLVFLIGRWLAGRARSALQPTLAKTTLAPSMARLIILAAYYGILLVTVIVALAVVGFPVTALLSASLIIVVILGVALQQSISNLAATIVFMLFQPFKLGELIEGNGVMGVVKEIQLFSTVLVTGDNKEITIPNAKIQGNNLLNYSRLGQLRVDFEFSVSYADNLGKAKQVLANVLAADPHVLAEPAPLIFVKSLDDSSVSIAVRPWATAADYWALQWTLPEKVKLAFDAEGITIPFPQRDVHLDPSRAGRSPSGRGAAESGGLEANAAERLKTAAHFSEAGRSRRSGALEDVSEAT